MNFIVFSDDWGRHPSSCEHLFRRLLSEHMVIWVNTIGYRKPSFSYYDIKRSIGKILSWFSSSSSSEEINESLNLHVISPVIIPFNNVRFIRWINKVMVGRSIRKAIAKMNFEDYILVSSLPNVTDFYKDHPGRLKIYYCVDDFTQFPGVDKKTIMDMEEDLANSSDLILYTARYLENKFSSHENKCHYLPHGVDYNHFNKLYRRSEKEKNEKPVIGFFGYLSQWVDFNLISYIAESKPEWEIMLIGGTDQNIDSLRQFDNIILTDNIKYDLLPQYAARFDIGIIPFITNELTMAVNPLKFLEYMAMGIPAVSTPLPELIRFGDHVYLSDNYNDFIKNIERAINEDSPKKRKRRNELAFEHSWDSRAKQLMDIIVRYDNMHA